MNLTQKRYAVERIQELAKAKLEKARRTLTVAPTRLKDLERVALIRSGKVRLRSAAAIRAMSHHNLSYISSVFDFSKFEDPTPEQTELTKRRKAIMAQSRKVQDQIMLGDGKKALKMIEDFEKF